MSENDPESRDTYKRPSVSLSKREEILRNADKILADMNLRKDVVGSLLTHKELQPNWAKVRKSCLNFSKSGHLLANPVVSKLFQEAEPLINQFQVSCLLYRSFTIPRKLQWWKIVVIKRRFQIHFLCMLLFMLKLTIQRCFVSIFSWVRFVPFSY
jgi:hypothetical protein